MSFLRPIPLFALFASLVLFGCSDDGFSDDPPDAGPAPDLTVALDRGPRPDAAAPPDRGPTPDTVPTPDQARPDAFVWPATCPHQNLKGQSGAALAQALHQLVDGHDSLGYTKARQAIFVKSAGGIDFDNGEVECIYTGQRFKSSGNAIPKEMGVEHSWPQSLGADREPARSDLHHLFACESKVNSRRGNYPFAECDCSSAGCGCSWQGSQGSKLGYDQRDPTCSRRAFDVRPTRRGDIARAQFYFSLRYLMPIAAEDEQVLRRWHQADPPDALERKRNAAVEKLQKNRNPLVDCPHFVALISDF